MTSRDRHSPALGEPRFSVRDYLLWSLAALIVAVPYFKGLYFERERFIAEIATFLLFLVWLRVSSRPVRGARVFSVFLEASPGIASVALFLAYVIAVPLAASVRSAMGEALTMGFVVCVSWLAAELVAEERHLDLLLGAVAVSGVVVAAIGMAAVTDVFTYPSAWETGRLYSTLQYPNTAASVLMAAYFAALTVSLKAAGAFEPSRFAPAPRLWRNAAKTALWAGAGTLIFAGFILTQSRGAWVVFPLVIVLYAVGLHRNAALCGLILVSATIGAGAVAATRFVRFLEPLEPLGAWTWTLGMCCVSAAVAVVGSWFVSRKPEPPIEAVPVDTPGRSEATARVAFVSCSVAAVAGLLAVAVVLARRGAFTGPLSRLAFISLSEASARERLMWARDALRIALDHPLTGVGGGGWALVYHRYKAYPYYSKLVHNHFAQVLADTGFTGLAAYVCLWLSVLVILWRIRRRQGDDGVRASSWGAGMVAVALGVHGTLDFNLSYPAVAVILWAMLGAMLGGHHILGLAEGHKPVWDWLRSATPRKTAVGLVVISLLLTVSLTASGLAGAAARKAWSEGRPDEAIRLMQAACTLDPSSASVKADLGQYCERLGEQRRDAALLRTCAASFAAAATLNPNESGIRLHYASVLSKMGQAQAAINNTKAAIAADRFVGRGYEMLTGLYVIMGKQLALSGKPDEAREAFAEAIKVLPTLERVYADIPEPLKPLCLLGLDSEVTPMMRLGRAQAQFFTGNRDAAAVELKPALESEDPMIRAQALFWEALCEAATGDHRGPGKKMQEAIKIMPEVANEGPRAKEICRILGLPYKL